MEKYIDGGIFVSLYDALYFGETNDTPVTIRLAIFKPISFIFIYFFFEPKRMLDYNWVNQLQH